MARNRPDSLSGKVPLSVLAGLLIAFAALALIAGAYAWIKKPLASSHSTQLEQIVIATNTEYVGTCPIIAARDKGYFSDEGVAVTVQPHSSGKAAMDAVLQGDANLGTVADIPIMFAGINERPVWVIATIFKTGKDHGTIGRRDKGVVTPGSLKGKRIGVTLNTSGHFALDALINRQKLSPSDVTLINYKPEDLRAALIRGDIDAAATWEPFLDAMSSQLGSNAAVFYGQDIYDSLYNIVGLQEYITGHPETVRKILRALMRGEQFCSESPDAARDLISPMIKSDSAKLKALWPSYRFNVVLDQGLILALEDEARWAIKNKLADKDVVPNYLNYIYLNGLESVKPSAVTIIH